MHTQFLEKLKESNQKAFNELIFVSEYKNTKTNIIVNDGFDDCRITNMPLRYDFYLELNNSKIIIEYNGRQHYMDIDFFHRDEGSFEMAKQRDEFKKEYCRKNNIRMIVIPYTEEKNIEKILKKELNI